MEGVEEVVEAVMAEGTPPPHSGTADRCLFLHYELYRLSEGVSGSSVCRLLIACVRRANTASPGPLLHAVPYFESDKLMVRKKHTTDRFSLKYTWRVAWNMQRVAQEVVQEACSLFPEGRTS